MSTPHTLVVENMKFRVPTTAASEAVQQELFKLGFRWGKSPVMVPAHTDQPYLYADFHNMLITCGEPDGEEFFRTSESTSHHREIFVQAVTTVTFTLEPDTVEIDGKVYELAEVKLAIAKLLPR